MSIVAWDGKTVAADRQVTEGDIPHLCKKIMRIRGGDIVAFVGDMRHGLEMVSWYRSGGHVRTYPRAKKSESATLIVFTRAGNVYEFDGGPQRMPVADKFMAWGSGKGVALGAMTMGADSRRAVKIASRYNSSCGLGVTMFRI